MKKLSFVLGYAGAILALICSLLMIYMVPAGLLSKAVEDAKFSLSNEDVLALNEVGLAMQHTAITDYSEAGITSFAEGVAQSSQIIQDKHVYDEAVAFAYKTVVNAAVSMAFVGISIIFALIAFIGALICRKAATGGGVMMLLSALVLLLCAIYTDTVVPAIIASVLLTMAGISAFIPVRHSEGAHARRRPREPQIRKPAQQYQQFQYQAQQYQQPPYQPQMYRPPYQPQQNVQVQVPLEEEGYVSGADERQDIVPFPDEDPAMFSQPAQEDNIKE